MLEYEELHALSFENEELVKLFTNVPSYRAMLSNLSSTINSVLGFCDLSIKKST